jgi:hypothetical protein
MSFLPNFTNVEAKNVFTKLNSDSNHHQYWQMTSQSDIDPDHQPHQGIAATHPEQRQSIQGKVTKHSHYKND